MSVGHRAHAHQADSVFAHAALAQFVDHARQRRGPVPAYVFDDRLGLGTGLMIEEVDENRGSVVAGK
jgi:hypothetical protein